MPAVTGNHLVVFMQVAVAVPTKRQLTAHKAALAVAARVDQLLNFQPLELLTPAVVAVAQL